MSIPSFDTSTFNPGTPIVEDATIEPSPASDPDSVVNNAVPSSDVPVINEIATGEPNPATIPDPSGTDPNAEITTPDAPLLDQVTTTPTPAPALTPQSVIHTGISKGIAVVKTKACSLWSPCRSRAKRQSSAVNFPLVARQNTEGVPENPDEESGPVENLPGGGSGPGEIFPGGGSEPDPDQGADPVPGGGSEPVDPVSGGGNQPVDPVSGGGSEPVDPVSGGGSELVDPDPGQGSDTNIGQPPPPDEPSPQTHPKACGLWDWYKCDGWFGKRSSTAVHVHSLVSRQDTDPSTPPSSISVPDLEDINLPPDEVAPVAEIKIPGWDLWSKGWGKGWGNGWRRPWSKRKEGAKASMHRGGWSLWNGGTSPYRKRAETAGIAVRRDENHKVPRAIDKSHAKVKAGSLWGSSA